MSPKLSESVRKAQLINRSLAKLYPQAKCALLHESPLQLLIATILSAQCTDMMVNRVTPALFARFGSAADFASASIEELELLIRSTGFFRNKAKNIQACCQMLLDCHAGQVPGTMAELVRLPGVARKTANVVLGECFGTPGVTVDTHVGRLSRRMGLTTHLDPVKVEADLNAVVPTNDWTIFSHRMIYHGRLVCSARKPRCSECALESICPKWEVEE